MRDFSADCVTVTSSVKVCSERMLVKVVRSTVMESFRVAVGSGVFVRPERVTVTHSEKVDDDDCDARTSEKDDVAMKVSVLPRVTVSVAAADTVSDGVSMSTLLSVLASERLAVTSSVTVMVSDSVALGGEAVSVCVASSVAVTDRALLSERVPDCDMSLVVDSVGSSDSVGDADGVRDMLGDSVREGLGVSSSVKVLGDGDVDGVSVAVRETLDVGFSLSDSVSDGDADGDGDAVGWCDGLPVREGLSCVREAETVREVEGVGGGVRVGVSDRLLADRERVSV